MIDLPRSKTDAAAELLALVELSYSGVAARVGVDRRTVFRWRRDPAFRAKVAAIRAGLCEAAYDYGVALRLARVTALNERWGRLHRIMEARAADPAMARAPGGATGLLGCKVRSLRTGGGPLIVEDFALDSGLLAEFRAIEERAARELGQWGTGPEGAAGDVRRSRDFEPPPDLSRLSDEGLLTLSAILNRAAGPDGGVANGAGDRTPDAGSGGVFSPAVDLASGLVGPVDSGQRVEELGGDGRVIHGFVVVDHPVVGLAVDAVEDDPDEANIPGEGAGDQGFDNRLGQVPVVLIEPAAEDRGDADRALGPASGVARLAGAPGAEVAILGSVTL